MVFHWSLRDNKSPQVSRTLLSILADFSNTVVYIVFTRPSSLVIFTNPVMTVPRAQTTSGITVTPMFHSFFQFPSKVQFLLLIIIINVVHSQFEFSEFSLPISLCSKALDLLQKYSLYRSSPFFIPLIQIFSHFMSYQFHHYHCHLHFSLFSLFLFNLWNTPTVSSTVG